MTVVLAVGMLVLAITRFRRRILERSLRVAIFRLRLIGCGVMLVVGVLLELQVGQYLIRLDRRVDVLVAGFAILAIAALFEWLVDQKVKEAGVPVSGTFFSRKPY